MRKEIGVMKKFNFRIVILILLALLLISLLCACKDEDTTIVDTLERIEINVEPLPGDPYRVNDKIGIDLTTYVFPEDKTVIESGEFENSTGKINLVIPESIVAIRPRAFYNSEIVSITFNSNSFLQRNMVNSSAAFMKCENLKKVVFKNYAQIAPKMFMGCRSLETVEGPFFPSIGPSAFYDCESLQNFDFSKCIEIEDLAFNKVREAVLPSAEEIFVNMEKTDYKCGLSDEEFGKFSLEYKKVYISNQKKNSFPFGYNSELISVTLPEDITVIKAHAFTECISLKTVIFKGKIEKIEWDAFSNCKSLETIDVGTDLKTIEAFAFWLSGLVEIDLPEGLIEIQAHAFCDCESLNTLRLPSTVSDIGYAKFSNIVEINEIASKNTTIIVGDNPFWAGYPKADEHTYE